MKHQLPAVKKVEHEPGNLLMKGIKIKLTTSS